MSAEEVIDLFSPAQDRIQKVIDWAVSAGIRKERISQSTNKQVIKPESTTGMEADYITNTVDPI